MSRPRHPNKDLEQLLRDAERADWRIKKGGKYYMCRCPCPDQHMEHIHLTPSDPNYEKNKRKKMSKCTAWREG